MRALALCLVCACGDQQSPQAIAAAPITIDAAPACVAKLSGNLAAIVGADTCATLGDTLELAFADAQLADPLAMSFAITAPGDYTSETTATWSATTKRTIDHEDCLFLAGDQATPHGTFTLHLTDASPHGTLVIDQPVHATMFAVCGSPLVEHIEVSF